MKFKWNKRSSRKAAVTMSYARHSLGNMSIEEAVKHTLTIHSQYLELIDQTVLQAIIIEVTKLCRKHKKSIPA